MKIVQVAEIISQGGRSGTAEASDKSLSVDFRARKSGEQAPTPEHLFGAAYAACFHSAILSHAEKGHFKLVGSTVTAQVSLVENDRGEYGLRVELLAALPGVSRSDGEHLIHQAHTTCPYSKAVRGNIDVVVRLD
ncbi:MAG TPA: Ohr family peroxiredoxin [Opitutaceae bacterium]|nr:Ohr family peroxiredoxin [Opitutaceae bacterium]